MHRKRPRAERLVPLAAAALGLLSGCVRIAEPPDEPIAFYVSSRRDVLRLRRVVFVELAAEGDCPARIAWDTTEALAYAIQAKRFFHVDIVRRTDPVCRDLPLDRIGALDVHELPRIGKALSCQAVLFGRVRHFQPHPRMQMALNLKLVDLRDGKLVWGVDQAWDTADGNVENRIRKYFRREVRGGYEPLGYELVLNSPSAFERFVAYEAANTLPPRRLPPKPAARATAAASRPAGPDRQKSGK
jgi:hypothetical protein